MTVALSKTTASRSATSATPRLPDPRCGKASTQPATDDHCSLVPSAAEADAGGSRVTPAAVGDHTRTRHRTGHRCRRPPPERAGRRLPLPARTGSRRWSAYTRRSSTPSSSTGRPAGGREVVLVNAANRGAEDNITGDLLRGRRSGRSRRRRGGRYRRSRRRGRRDATMANTPGSRAGCRVSRYGRGQRPARALLAPICAWRSRRSSRRPARLNNL